MTLMESNQCYTPSRYYDKNTSVKTTFDSKILQVTSGYPSSGTSLL